MEDPTKVETENIDLSQLKSFLKTLACNRCSTLPRPKADVYLCSGCFAIFCENCRTARCARCNRVPINAPFLKNVSSIFKKHPCSYFKNGCQEEKLEQNLQTHENSCVFRNIACPDIRCTSQIVFQDVLNHYNILHASNLIVGDKNLESKGFTN